MYSHRNMRIQRHELSAWASGLLVGSVLERSLNTHWIRPKCQYFKTIYNTADVKYSRSTSERLLRINRCPISIGASYMAATSGDMRTDMLRPTDRNQLDERQRTNNQYVPVTICTAGSRWDSGNADDELIWEGIYLYTICVCIYKISLSVFK